MQTMNETGEAARIVDPTQSTNLFGLDRAALRAQFAAVDEAPWRADQVMQWIYRRGVDDFAGLAGGCSPRPPKRARLETDDFAFRPAPRPPAFARPRVMLSSSRAMAPLILPFHHRGGPNFSSAPREAICPLPEQACLGRQPQSAQVRCHSRLFVV